MPPTFAGMPPWAGGGGRAEREAMLSHPHPKKKRNSPSKDYLCWEACARMAFLRRYGDKELARYEKAVAPFVARGRGLNSEEMGMLCCMLLGMSARPNARYVIGKSPVIWREVHPIGHATI